MKKYLINRGICIQCKNQLQKEIAAFADSYHRVVINEDEYQNTLQAIIKQVDEFNTLYPRCTAETTYHYRSTSGDLSITIGVDRFVRLTLLKFEEI